MLEKRKVTILNIIVGEHIASAAPVGSESIARRYGLGISPATIRNEMAGLENEGYIVRPHSSAGGIPSDKGYRHYIESLEGHTRLSLEEQRMVRYQFQQVEAWGEEWARLAAALLARMVRNLAMVTLPKAMECRMKHLELVSLQEFLALLILVLREAKLKQQILPLEQALSQEELTTAANKLNAAYRGLNSSEIVAKNLELSSFEEQVMGASLRIMREEDEWEYEEPYVEGLRHILNQPEFLNRGKMQSMVEVFEDRSLLRTLIPRARGQGDVQVIIGGENQEDAMRDCGVVFAQYGIPSEAEGVIGVIGPTRMEYQRAIPAVRYLSSVMSERLVELY